MERKDYIGSSDAKHIISGDWDRMWRKKMGLVPDDDLTDSFPVQFGSHCEDFHLDWTTRRMRETSGAMWEFSKGPKPGDQHFAKATLDTENAPLLGSHPDALLRQAGETLAYPLEAKLTGRFANADEAADFYMPQLQHHMICWDIDLLMLSVVVGTTEPERIWVGASPEWQEHYARKCDAFWGFVIDKSAPPPSNFERGASAAPAKVPRAIADSVPLNGMRKRCLDGDNHAPGLIAEFVETKKAVKRHEAVKDELKGLIADDEGEIYLSDGSFKAKRDARGAIRFTIKEAA